VTTRWEDRTCACIDFDERRCFELRYYGYSPVLYADEDGAEDRWPEDCQCSCHAMEDEDDDD
jgi:hypothetical protein